MPVTIQEGGLATKDSSEILLYVFDYDAAIPVGAELSGIGTFTITPPAAPGAPTQSNQALLPGNRKVQVLLTGGAVGRTYTIEHNAGPTNENPAQTFAAWFKLRIS